MRQIKFQISLLFIFYAWFGNTQTVDVDLNDKINPNFPSEKIYLHINTNSIFVGENLFYKIYVVTGENLLSDYSKVAYVSLIGPDNNLVTKQKIKLSNGQGYGDLLIPPEIPTGNYKLISYTKMGLSHPTKTAFITNISIINPYISIDPNLVSVIDKVPKQKTNQDQANLDDKIKIKLVDRVFGKRKRVELKLETDDESHYGNYSISVKKIDSFQLDKPTIISKIDTYQNTVKLKNNSYFLPDLRGDLISGRLTTSHENTPVQHQKIAFLIPERNYILKIGNTDNQGRFYFNIDKSYSSNTAFLQVLNKFSEDYTFQIDEEALFDTSLLSFQKLSFYKVFKDQIIDRSIKNQVENSYSSLRQDSLKTIKTPSFFGDRNIRFYLDDFTRFPSLEETFLEVINGVGFRQKEDGYKIRVRANDDDLRSPINALVLVDGLVIQNHSKIFDFDADDIEYIDVVRDKYYFGGNVFQGVVSIKTFDDGYKNLTNLPGIKPVELFSPELEKIYHKVTYDRNNDLKHIPDFRTQLLWNPHIKISSPRTGLHFFTSDESGVYKIVLEGFSQKGEIIRTTAFFEVF